MGKLLQQKTMEVRPTARHLMIACLNEERNADSLACYGERQAVTEDCPSVGTTGP